MRNGDIVGKKRCIVIILGQNVIYLKRDRAVKCGYLFGRWDGNGKRDGGRKWRWRRKMRQDRR